MADGEGMGYLPGELDEKFALYCMPLVDNLNSIAKKCKSINVDYIMKNTIQCVPPNYMRGRSFEDAIIIVDEAQNMTYDQIQTLMTRISDTCKIVFMGSLNQIDLKNKKVSENGFKLVMDCCKQNGFEQEGLCGFVEFVQSMRSPFCVKVDKALTLFKQERNH